MHMKHRNTSAIFYTKKKKKNGYTKKMLMVAILALAPFGTTDKALPVTLSQSDFAKSEGLGKTALRIVKYFYDWHSQPKI